MATTEMSIQSGKQITNTLGDTVKKFTPTNIAKTISDVIIKAFRGYSTLTADSFTSAFEHLHKDGELISDASVVAKTTKALKGKALNDSLRYAGSTSKFCTTGLGSVVHLGLTAYSAISFAETARMYSQKWSNKGSFNIPDEDIVKLGLLTATTTAVGALPIMSSFARILHIVSGHGSRMISQTPGRITKFLGISANALGATHRATFGALQYILPKPLKFLGSYKFVTQMLFLTYLGMNEFLVKMPQGKSIFQNWAIGGKYLFRENNVQDPGYNFNLFGVRANRLIMAERARAKENHYAYSSMIVQKVQDWVRGKPSSSQVEDLQQINPQSPQIDVNSWNSAGAMALSPI